MQVLVVENFPPKNLSVFYANCDCLSQVKRLELESYIQLNSPDIIALTEILPKYKVFEVSEQVFTLNGYTSFSSN